MAARLPALGASLKRRGFGGTCMEGYTEVSAGTAAACGLVMPVCTLYLQAVALPVLYVESLSCMPCTLAASRCNSGRSATMHNTGKVSASSCLQEGGLTCTLFQHCRRSIVTRAHANPQPQTLPCLVVPRGKACVGE